jgi:streptogramin lyase
MPPTPSAPHTLRADSKGNIWYSSLYNVGKIGMLDVKTKKITEYIPAPAYKNTHFYGMTVDKKDRVWAVGMTASMLVGYDPRSEKWTVYPTPTPLSGPRRPSVAPDGRIWFTENTGDAIGVLDPDTGKITEYKSPFKYGGEYEVLPASDGNIWFTALAYDILVKFNPKTLKYTYYRNPEPMNSGRIPKLELDSQGNIWGAMGANVINFRPNGNVPAQLRSGLWSTCWAVGIFA